MSAEFLTFPIRSDKLTMTAKISEVVLHRKTEFQTIDVLRSEVFGKMLLLDGHIQLTEFDERAYHEGLVQIPMLNLPNARRALVVGGGDGGVVRELARHRDLERIDMVEIDAGVVEACREAMPSLNAGAFEDPRVNLMIADAFEFVKTAAGPYDLVVMDSTDVYEEEEGNLSEMLFTEGFYQDLRRLLSPDGIVVTQADNLVFCPYSMEAILELFGKVFPQTGSYQAVVPSFGGFSGYCWASLGRTLSPTWSTLTPKIDLAYLNEATYNWAFQELTLA